MSHIQLCYNNIQEMALFSIEFIIMGLMKPKLPFFKHLFKYKVNKFIVCNMCILIKKIH